MERLVNGAKDEATHRHICVGTCTPPVTSQPLKMNARRSKIIYLRDSNNCKIAKTYLTAQLATMPIVLLGYFAVIRV